MSQPSAGRLVDLYTQPLAECPTWISGGVLMKGGIMLIGGPAKIGKTMLGLDLAHNLATGGTLWGTDYKITTPVAPLYVDRELGVYGFHERVKHRYDTLGVRPPDNFYYMTKTRGLYLDTAGGIGILGEEISKTGVRVVFIDPVSRCMMGDENSNTDVNRLFTNFDGLLADFPDLSLILTHHFGKPPKEDDDSYDPFSPYNFRGASKWFDAPDTLVTFQRTCGALPGEWWRLRTGWEMRHAPNPADQLILAVGEGGLVHRVERPAAVAGPKALKPAGGWKR
jgi:hypothetical protein